MNAYIQKAYIYVIILTSKDLSEFSAILWLDYMPFLSWYCFAIEDRDGIKYGDTEPGIEVKVLVSWQHYGQYLCSVLTLQGGRVA